MRTRTRRWGMLLAVSLLLCAGSSRAAVLTTVSEDPGIFTSTWSGILAEQTSFFDFDPATDGGDGEITSRVLFDAFHPGNATLAYVYEITLYPGYPNAASGLTLEFPSVADGTLYDFNAYLGGVSPTAASLDGGVLAVSFLDAGGSATLTPGAVSVFALLSTDRPGTVAATLLDDAGGTVTVPVLAPVSVPVPVPEPGTGMLLGSGLAGLAGSGIRRRSFRK